MNLLPPGYRFRLRSRVDTVAGGRCDEAEDDHDGPGEASGVATNAGSQAISTPLGNVERT